MISLSRLHPLAQQLNAVLREQHSPLFSLLSKRGKAIYFPFDGILGQTAEAKGKKYDATIGIALEDDGTPMRLRAIDACVDLPPGEVFSYAPSFGKKELREKWRQMILEKNPSLSAEISLPVVAGGITHAMSVVASALLDAGDELLLPDLYWGNYDLIFSHMYGATLRTFRTFNDGGFDTGALRSALRRGKGKKVLLLNFPNNPSGYTPTVEEAQCIVSIIRERADAGDTIAVLLDDAYFGLVYREGVFRESLFSLLADLHERVLAVKIDGASKEEYVWGLRIGFVTFAAKGMTPAVREAFEAKLAGTVRATVSSASHLSQSLLLAAYAAESYEREKQEKYAILKDRFEEVQRVLSDPKYASVFTPLPFNSGYFLCVELREGLNAEAIRRKLLSTFDTGVIALGNTFRIAYSSLPVSAIRPLFEHLFLACSPSRTGQ
ncbi:hypothetical protein A2454_04995 [Candidatus Peribacteria bacterium RIFOXYC2_FULL_55_14]|nr:MAG: Aminotransferase class I and II [Candidatus Peregrinibacteria bacterium GW2011_GWA2_54_9]OGJ72556.1 MAG: hypothetical protein A2198_01920 [Candidatus Peribacteria bacterium RIFOXYA1_FULL_56_14]OGJ73679.1 MAG: hypothetical protein A2217_06160 [Candidatus Peribacteria bacterium RIFOXYA2_FULL_55_28]OGJ75296.1 MAG: hypothetical protein A2384_00105 [Candidatus Peribacteria bacterium RIFOXYB1_FULL_54_35]OGJ76529.1 MAG: hypothetical protein A2327_01775 [Candidatus Peribacteria bacterium RIFOXY